MSSIRQPEKTSGLDEILTICVMRLVNVSHGDYMPISFAENGKRHLSATLVF